jgi:malate dehydrogenase (oxaloacetate-decarboxylating)(NADP+)
VTDNIEKIAPLIYTPTVGLVCQQFGYQFRRSRGMYFSHQDRGLFSQMVYNWPHDDVRVIVVTDGSRILGLGDLGVHGMGIPVGKLALYCAAGGIAPHRVLPVTIDVGTNNEQLLADPHYQGTRVRRLTGDAYVSLIDEFVQACFKRWPQVLIQFEDFENTKAAPLLERYRHTHRVFNDDIQGTGSVTLSALLSAARNAGTSIREMSFVCAGSGSAGLGVCSQIVDGMVESGLSRQEAMSRFIVVTSKGALGRTDGTYGDPNHQRAFPEDRIPWINKKVPDGASLLEAVKLTKPTVLLGLSAQANVFTEEIIREMAKNCEHPIIMPMSNPTSKCECTAENAYKWTDGRAVVATGSPFDPVYYNGKTYITSQCNNMYVFPGIGLAASVSGVKHITDKMLYLASVACTNTMTEDEISEGRTFPKLSRIREVSANVAVAIIKEAITQKLTTRIEGTYTDEELLQIVKKAMYYPNYVPLV